MGALEHGLSIRRLVSVWPAGISSLRQVFATRDDEPSLALENIEPQPELSKDG